MSTTTSPFASLGLSDDVVAAIVSAGYEAPTAVQQEGIPAFLAGGDIVFQAQTGTGKTAAFVLPIIERLVANPGSVEALVLTPTRELAHQVCEEFVRFGAPRGIRATAIYGGTGFQAQYDALETAQVVVATPGRLLDLIGRKRFRSDRVRFFGLDEADELLSMGFEKDVLEIISTLPESKQSFLCSATFNDAVQRVARNFVTDPVRVDVSSDQIGAQSVRHEFFKVRGADKLDALHRLVRGDARTGAIVFANTRAATFAVTDALIREGVSCDVLNGDLTQAEREEALDRMKNDQVQFLVATDVAARGIDISGLPAVINFDMPESADVYIHRTGRTGRAGQAGVAYSLVAPSDVTVFHQLQKFYKLEFHPRELPTESDLLAVAADAAIASTLDALDAGGTLDYGAHIPLARRLAARADGARIIAKLIAHFAGAAPETVAPNIISRRPAREQAQVAAPEIASAPAAVAPAGDTAAALASLLDAPNDRPGRWMPVDDLAVAAGITLAAAEAALSGDARFEASRKFAGQWRTFRSSPSPGSAPAAAAPAAAAPASSTPVAAATETANPAQSGARKTRRTRGVDVADGGADTAAPDHAAAPAPAAASRPAAGPRPAAPPAAQAKPAAAPEEGPAAGFSTLHFNLGSEHFATEDALAEALVEFAGFDREDVGRVVLKRSSADVDVASDFAADFAKALNGQTLGGVTVSVSGVKFGARRTRPERRSNNNGGGRR